MGYRSIETLFSNAAIRRIAFNSCLAVQTIFPAQLFELIAEAGERIRPVLILRVHSNRPSYWPIRRWIVASLWERSKAKLLLSVIMGLVQVKCDLKVFWAIGESRKLFNRSNITRRHILVSDRRNGPFRNKFSAFFHFRLWRMISACSLTSRRI